MTPDDFSALRTTLLLALVSTLILLALGAPLAWWISKSTNKFRHFIEALVALPLILPPTVLGFYLLIALGPEGVVGQLAGRSLAFSFEGLVIGSVIYSLPFVVQPLQTAFASIGTWPQEVAATLGANRIDRFRSIIFPMSKRGFVSAFVLGFAHTIGEFGVVLMIGGNIPGQTQVLSIRIYEYVEALQYDKAHLLSAGLLVISFIALLWMYSLRSITLRSAP